MAEQSSRRTNPFEGKFSEETLTHFRTAREEFRKSVAGMLPPGVEEHHRNARKELLLAWRSMIDASLERMEKPKKKA
jgi:ribosomal protein L13